ncbi:MAG TPA: glycosyltransferase family 87 protein [Thermoanaerobaculia bacterium]|nr:glycosyltransferase family 87 protein [Thermoanaerobaculia bacterium]
MPGAFRSHGTTLFLIAYASALAGWGLCVVSRLRPGWAFLIAVVIAVRIVPALTSPELSHDVYRYLWDGRVAAAGINPYAFAPADPRLEGLRTEWHALINHPEIRSIYPPAAQAVFLFVGLSGTGLAGWKGLLLLADLLTIGIIARRWDSRTALAYGLFPLVLIEGAWNAHIELLMTLILLVAYLSLIRGRDVAAGGFLALATLVKIVPIVALPVFLRHANRRLALCAVFAGTTAVFVVPFVRTGLMPGFGEYARRWSFNSPAYELVASGIEWMHVTESLRSGWTHVKDLLGVERISPHVYSLLYPDAVTRAILGVALILALFAAMRTSHTPASAVANSIGVLLLCSPAVHPWYWLALVPFAILSRGIPWILLAAASPYSYMLYDGRSPWLVFAVCYGLPLIVAAVVRMWFKPPNEDLGS